MAPKKSPPPELRQEVASIARDPWQISFAGILRNQDDTLLTRGGVKGLKLYEEIERDPHAYAVLQKRKMAVVAREWTVEPASDSAPDQKAAEIVMRQLKALDFDALTYGLLDAVNKGFASAEVIWDIVGGEIAAIEAPIRDQRRFLFAEDYSPRLLTITNFWPGEPLPERKFVFHRFGAKDGTPYGLGLGTRLYWMVLFKRNALRFWLTFADKFGSPTALGTYRPNATPQEVQTLLAAMQAIAQDAGIAVPEGMAISLLEAARAGSVDTYDKLVRYLDAQISECVLGETLTTTIGDTGSYAAAGVHNQVREELTDADADMLSATINATLVNWITEFNVEGATPPKVYRAKPADELAEAELRKKNAELDEALARLGWAPTEERIKQVYGEGYERRPPAPSPQPFDPRAAFAAPDETGAVDRYIDRAAAETQGVIDAFVDKVRAAIGAAGSLEEARDKIIEAFPDLDDAAFAAVMQRALAAAELAGRFEAKP